MASCSLRITKAQRETARDQSVRRAWVLLDRTRPANSYQWKSGKTSREESQTYFHSRPVGQLSAWASRQSEVLDGRRVLDARMAEMTERFGDKPIHCRRTGAVIDSSRIKWNFGRPFQPFARPVSVRGRRTAWLIERLAP